MRALFLTLFLALGLGPRTAEGEPKPAAPPSEAPPSGASPSRSQAPDPGPQTSCPPCPDAGLPYPPDHPKPGDLTHVATGLPLTFEALLDLAAGSRVVAFGETHDNLEVKAAQVRLVDALEKRFPGRVAIGLEMFREDQQPVLDRWTRGELNEAEFLKEVRWFHAWGGDWGYYRDLLLLARDRRMDVVALNPAADLDDAVRSAPLEALPEGVRARLPEIAPADRWQRVAAKAVFDAHAHGRGDFEAFLRVQVLWEESMAQRAAAYLGSPRGAGRRLVTVTGGWHVRYGFGLPRKLLRRGILPVTIVLAEEATDAGDRPDRRMDVSLPVVPLAVGDVVWWVGFRDLAGTRARLGIRFVEVQGAPTVASVTDGSPASRAGVRAGDVLVQVDGVPLRDREDLLAAMATRRVGERVRLVVRRDGATLDLPIELTPMTDAGPH